MSGAEPKPIRVGVVGCGSIAQIMHLPHLKQLHESFELAALCDVSPGVLAYCGERFGVEPAGRFASLEAMLERAELEALVVCDILHSDAAAAGLDAGCHVLVEKPLAHNLAECDRILEAAARSGKTLMLAYMKRYDPGYEYAQARVRKLKDIFHVRAHDFLGPNASFTADIHDVRVFQDAPPNETRQHYEQRVDDALGGDASPLSRRVYGTLLGLCSHDLAVLRGLFGPPKGVVSVLAGAQGRVFHALLDYGETMTGMLEYGHFQLRKFDEVLSVYAASEVVKIKFPCPFIPFASTLVEIWEPEGPGRAERPERPGLPGGTAGQGLKESTVAASSDESFRRELEHFAHCIRSGERPRTPPEEGRDDVRLCIEMAQAVKT